MLVLSTLYDVNSWPLTDNSCGAIRSRCTATGGGRFFGSARMILTYRYQLRTTARQRAELQAILDQQRWLYNEALGWRTFAYEVYGASVTYMDQCRWVTYKRSQDDRLSSLPANVQRATLKRLDTAFSGFFSRVRRGEKPGYPRFRGRDRFDSFGFAEFVGIRLTGKQLRFKGVSGGLKINLHRPLPGYEKILSCSFKRKANGRWEVALVLRVPTPDRKPVETAVGIDVGLTTLATLSTGEEIPNVRPTIQAERELRVAQRALSRCQRGSNRRAKVKASVNRIHETIRNTRSTYLHQVSADLVRRFDLIAVEDLNIRGLAQTRLAKSITDAAWGRLRFMLTYKAECAGCQLVAVDARYTSQDCSRCGERVPKPLSERVHSCPSCGLVLGRDHNAALNILHRGVVAAALPNVAGCGVRATDSTNPSSVTG